MRGQCQEGMESEVQDRKILMSKYRGMWVVVEKEGGIGYVSNVGVIYAAHCSTLVHQIQSAMLHPAILLIVLLLLALLPTAAPQLTLHLSHPAPRHFSPRHQLSARHNKLVIHHDMRVFPQQHSTHLSHDQASTQTYSITDHGYYFTIHLTVNGLPYNLNIDTGSSDLFIKGEQSAGNPANKYSCEECLKNNRKYKIGYMDGPLDTYLNQMDVQIGQHSFKEWLLVAYTASKNFEAAEGLMGLSFPELARNPHPTFLQTLINNKIIDSYSFGVNLNFQQHNRSFISFGKPDPAHYRGELHRYPLQSGHSYNIKVKGISVGSDRLLRISNSIFDTGNTCISIPSQYADDVLRKFNTNGNKCGFDNEESAPQFSLLRCLVRDFAALPPFKIWIGEEIYEIDRETYIQRCVKNGEELLCDLYVESVKNSNQLFLGDGFFNRYYTFFDLELRQIGIARNQQDLSHTYMMKEASELDDEDWAFFGGLR